MSVYSQSQYGQPYPAPAFTPPAVHGGYLYQHPPALPPPQPVYHVDPMTFRRDYTNRLAELTMNSRPIIQSLSMLAQEYSRFAEIVGQCLEAHIRRVPPWIKLPAFYLLDAISKNVYEPYARQFATFVVPLFLETYNQVDQNTRSKMEEMLLTWRNGSPSGRELFGIPPQLAIERGVWGDGASSNDFYSGSGQITKSQVLSELIFTLGQKERALQANPYDTMSQNHINVLQQLRKLVEAGVSQDELQQILSQLRALVRTAPPPPQPQPQPQTAQQPAAAWPSQPMYPTYNPPAPAPPPVQQPSSYAYPTFEALKSEDGSLLSIPAVSASLPAVSTPAPASLVPSGDISSLLSSLGSLVKAGAVSGAGPSTGISTTGQLEDGALSSGAPLGADSLVREEERKPAVDLERLASRAYRKAIISYPIKLTTADITRKRPNIVDLLYNQLPAQCKQCGLRFAENATGKKKLQDHLDMHFRQNRKANQNIGRGHSRSWFVGMEDWITDVAVDVKGKGRADGVRPGNAKAAAAAEVAKREAELRALYVVVPPGDEAKPISCPICKETLKSEFLEEDEDWVWKNAIKKDDRVYHATCHAEAVASTNSLAARLRTELANSSRSGTPEAQSSTPVQSRSPPHGASVRASQSPPRATNVVGTKRKVEHETALNGEADGTPPFKKLALSAAA